MQFNERLKKLRTEKGVSQAELAEKIFVSRSAVAKWENGLGLPSEASLTMLAEYFAVSKEELLSETVTEAAIVNKNITISKYRKGLIVLIVAACLLIAIAVLATVLILNRLNRDDGIAGDSVARIVGVGGDIYHSKGEYDNGDLKGSAFPEFDDYFLEIGKTYYLQITPQLTGGSTPVALTPEGIALTYDADTFEIALSENSNLNPFYALSVKKECKKSSIVISSFGFIDVLIISTK